MTPGPGPMLSLNCKATAPPAQVSVRAPPRPLPLQHVSHLGYVGWTMWTEGHGTLISPLLAAVTINLPVSHVLLRGGAFLTVLFLVSPRGFLNDPFLKEGPDGPIARLMKGQITFSQVRGHRGTLGRHAALAFAWRWPSNPKGGTTSSPCA